MRWAMLRLLVFLLAFAVFAALLPTVGWTVAMKVFAAAVTMTGASLLV